MRALRGYRLYNERVKPMALENRWTGYLSAVVGTGAVDWSTEAFQRTCEHHHGRARPPAGSSFPMEKSGSNQVRAAKERE